MLAWLEGLGVVPGAPADGTKVPNVVVSKLPTASHGGPRKPGKRRAADGGAEGTAKRRTKGGHDEGGISFEVIVRHELNSKLLRPTGIIPPRKDACISASANCRFGSAFGCPCIPLRWKPTDCAL